MPDRDPWTEKLPRPAWNLLRRVETCEERILRRRSRKVPGLWRAAGLAGMIGWTVVLPMLGGVALGAWIDRRWPSRFSWTLMLLVGGLLLGCVNAWMRIEHERRER